MARRRKTNSHPSYRDSCAPANESAPLAQRIEEICLDAVASVSPAKVEEIALQWLSKRNLDPDAPSSAVLVMEAFALAGYLALFTPTLLGAAPIERFIRQRRADADDRGRAALDALAPASFYLLRLKSRASPQSLVAEDLRTGETLNVFDEDIPIGAMGADVAAWLAPLADGVFVALGPLTPLDAAALAEGLSFVRPGKGVGNPRRCAAAVYRHVMRHGGLHIEGLNLFPEDLFEELASLAEEEEYDDLDRLAYAVAATKKGEEPSAETIGEARRLASAPHLIQAMTRSVISRQDGRSDLAEAFSRISFIMMETLDRRAAAGSGDEDQSLEFIAAVIDRAVKEKRLPGETRSLFEELRRRLLASRRAGADKGAGDAELARVLQRIQALRAKTVEQGCTEQEALASAKKVAELLDRYGLSLGEVEMRDQACEGVGVDTGRRRRAPLDECVPTIALFCDCKTWAETAASGAIRYVFFGMPADVEAAHYLYELIVIAFATETTRFKNEDMTIASSARRGSTRSFQIGLAHGICDKLMTMKAERDAANRLSSGRDLVPIKASVIDDELGKLGLSFHVKAESRKRLVAPDAYHAGREAGRKFEPRRGVEAA
ncbi:DUF2786 domain-containing protein [Methylocystis suflitae]|uniref:DUF2786 domain-containing protein n=1 Tax=Methylocystis suflitae TaxID=2951405 RepID=UPI00210CEAD7|nr:DUF2786 domain-containing protein [Methylocystis suflitae]MCQ4190983.1 DUF2786 domain-containing protein [Methylocystis suflitae]